MQCKTIRFNIFIVSFSISLTFKIELLLYTESCYSHYIDVYLRYRLHLIIVSSEGKRDSSVEIRACHTTMRNKVQIPSTCAKRSACHSAPISPNTGRGQQEHPRVFSPFTVAGMVTSRLSQWRWLVKHRCSHCSSWTTTLCTLNDWWAFAGIFTVFTHIRTMLCAWSSSNLFLPL